MSKRILLADDSVTIQKVIELTFMDGDFEVKAVSNGDEALALLAATKVDFIIADVHMPGANGYEVCRQAKQLRPNLPVLLLVGTFEPFDEAQAKSCGADSFLKKPFDSQELLQRVHDLLDARQADVPAEEPSAPASDFELPFAAPAVFQAPAAVAPTPDWHHEPRFELEPEPELPAVTPFARPTPVPETHPFSLGASEEPFRLDEERPFSLGGLDDSPSRPSEAPPAEPHAAPSPAHDPGDQPFSLGDPLDDRSAFTVEEDHPFALQAPHWDPAAAEEHPFTLGDDRDPGAAVSLAPEPTRPETPTEPFRLRPLADSLAAQAAHETPGHEPAADSAGARPAGFGEWGPVEIDDRIDFEEDDAPVAGGAAPSSDAAAALSSPAETHGTESHGTEAAGAEIHNEWSVPIPTVPAPPAGALAVGQFAAASAALSDADVDRIARRVVELMGDGVVKEIAWEVIPDLAEIVVKNRLRELEGQIS